MRVRSFLRVLLLHHADNGKTLARCAEQFDVRVDQSYAYVLERPRRLVTKNPNKRPLRIHHHKFWRLRHLRAASWKRHPPFSHSILQKKSNSKNEITMAKTRSETVPRAAHRNNALSESESESDSDLRYRLPHSFSTSTTPGSSERPITIPDETLAGTPDEPIWISDVEVTDNEPETDTDVSNAAIRGTRKHESRKVSSSATPRASQQSKIKQKESKKSVEPKKQTISAPKKSVLPPLSTPMKAQGPSSTPSTPANAQGSSRKLNNTLSEETPVSTNIKKKSKEKQTKLKEKKTESSNEKQTKSKKTKEAKSVAKTAPAPALDIASLASEGDDPVLEDELEEIALNWRAGMISGTPSAHDIEKGNKNASIPSFAPPAAPIEEDEADRSWHNPISNDKPKGNRRQRWYLLLSVAGLLAIIGCLIFVLKKDKKDSGVMETEASLTDRQQAMHNLLTRVTDASILKNPVTPQHKARKWLLFRDRDLPSTEEERIIQRYALACLFYSTSGDKEWNQNNWLSGDECGDTPWTGLNCNSEGGVRAIVLDNEGLAGTIPVEVGHLMNLEHLILKNNPDLFGWVPATLAHIKSLSQIGLYKNALSGTIPDIFQHANQIRYINLEGNNMHGSIPMSIKRLSNLDTLALANNKFDGIVPIAELAKTTLKYLSLSGNEFSGMLEHSIKDMTSIEHLYLDNNKMRGPVPFEISTLTNLKSLDLGSNIFTGTVPTELGLLQRLEFLSMNRNKLQGALPRQLALLTNLKSLNLASNELVGTLPNIANMVRLANLQLFENQLTGSIPEGVQQLQSIEVLSLSSNKLDGTIPRTISRLSRTLRGLYLSDNAFQGRIPTELCEFGSLEALFLDTNNLFGPIPPCLGDLSELQQLFVFKNQLTGQIPSTFGDLGQLTGLGLEDNGLTGEIPDGVCSLVDDFSLNIWADCTDQFGSDPLLCDCCSVCCPSDECK